MQNKATNWQRIRHYIIFVGLKIKEEMKRNNNSGITLFIIAALLHSFSPEVFSQTALGSYNCTGGTQTYTVPAGVCQIQIKAWGGGGGGGGVDSYVGGTGGGGSYATVTINVAPGDVLTIYAGCLGIGGIGCTTNPGGGGGWGYGNGGNGGAAGPVPCSGPGGGGGGSSGVRLNGVPVIVAAGGAGGGGGGCNSAGGAGGAGGINGSSTACGAGGGTASSSGSPNGNTGTSHTADGGGGGGGGGGYVNGGNGGGVPPVGPSCGIGDCGAAGGGGGDSFGTITLGSGATPGNSADPDLCAGCAQGGGSQANGTSGFVKLFSIPAVSVTVAGQNILCNGQCTGTAAATPLCGTVPYSYLWNNGQTAQTATGLCAGTYSVTVTDAVGSTAVNTVTITQPPLLTAAVTAAAVLCNGGTTSATAAPSGGTPPYTYAWSNSQFTPTATGLIAGTYSVLVIDANGCTFTTSVTITQPSALSIAASTTTEFCNRSDGTASVTAAGGTGTYTYLWNPTSQISSTATGLAAGNYSITVTDANGCTHDTSIVVNFTPGPTAVAGAGGSICFGNSIALNASGGGTYSWTPAAALSNPLVSNPVASPTATTNYTVIVTDANNCSASDNLTVTVNPKPVPAFLAPNVCFNNSASFTDQSSTPSGTITGWNWSFGDGNFSTLQNPSHTYAAYGTFTVQLVAVNSFGCIDSISHIITVNPLPNATFSSTTVCFGNQTCFSDLSTIPSGTVTGWSWNFADLNSGPNNISYAQNPCHVFTSAGTFNVLLTVTSDSGCQSNTFLPAVVMALPVAGWSAQAVCYTSPSVFTNTSSSGSQWNWNFGDGNFSTQQSPSHTYATYGTYTVTQIVTSSGGCKDTLAQTITVYALPIVNFATDTVCLGDTTLFTDLSSIPSGSITSWNWNFGDGNSSSLQNPVHAYSSSGTFNAALTVTSNNGCANTLALAVVVHPLPKADFSYAPANITLVDEVAFTDLTTGGAVQWFWNFGDSTTDTLQFPSHVYNNVGTYTVTLIATSYYGCKDTVMQEIEVNQYAFYIPNTFTPNGDGINDFFFGAGIGIADYEFSIFDRWGNLIFHCHVNDLPQTPACRWDGIIRTGTSGEPVQQDVYVWKVKLTSVFKREYNFTGTVTVVK
ncbi:MAG: PKD domain-containing protein [Bacteroidetes bacterium]|nr:PKD domain-containing protein [Bacteroidota bacterium]